MALDRLVLNLSGFRELRSGPWAKSLVKEHADRIAAAAGPGMEAEVRVGRTRARATVMTETSAARVAEARNRSLTRAIDAGRG